MNWEELEVGDTFDGGTVFAGITNEPVCGRVYRKDFDGTLYVELSYFGVLVGRKVGTPMADPTHYMWGDTK